MWVEELGLAGRQGSIEGKMQRYRVDRQASQKGYGNGNDRALGLQMLACLSAAVPNRPDAPPAL
jgi:hypothetical protein